MRCEAGRALQGNSELHALFATHEYANEAGLPVKAESSATSAGHPGGSRLSWRDQGER